jgi:transcription elongation factor Elf1
MNEQINDRRDPNLPDRRNVPRGGRRASDLPHPLVCPSCGKIQDVQGLANSRVVRWCHCRACGEVWPWSMEL